MDNMSPEFILLELMEWQAKKMSEQSDSGNYFTIIISFDEIEVELGNERFTVDGNRLIFIGPQKKFNIKQRQSDAVHILCFGPRFYEKSYTDALILNSDLFFDKTEQITITEMSKNELEFNRHIIERIRNAVKMGRGAFDLVAHNCIESLLLNGIWRKKKQHNEACGVKLSDRCTLNLFTTLVHRHYKEETNVKFYADKLNITRRKLSDICLSVLNRPAKTAIMEIVLKEALRYIKNTELSISQISYEMGFSDESNFRHFIKKHTGYIPLEHRRRTFQNSIRNNTVINLMDEYR